MSRVAYSYGASAQSRAVMDSLDEELFTSVTKGRGKIARVGSRCNLMENTMTSRRVTLKGVENIPQPVSASLAPTISMKNMLKSEGLSTRKGRDTTNEGIWDAPSVNDASRKLHGRRAKPQVTRVNTKGNLTVQGPTPSFALKAGRPSRLPVSQQAAIDALLASSTIAHTATDQYAKGRAHGPIMTRGEIEHKKKVKEEAKAKERARARRRKHAIRMAI